jgi:hypothetical protein
MAEFNSIEELAKAVKNKLNLSIVEKAKGIVAKNKKKIVALYAFNSTGKTRLSNEFELLNNEEGEEYKYKVLCYNAFLEDLFKWDNENYILSFEKKSWVALLIEEEGLEGKIIDNFNTIVTSKIEPSFNLKKGEITFNIASGDNENTENIKCSKSEESILIWSIFFTALESVIEILNDEKENRTTSKFNDLEYVIIDDPVSSIDDTKIISMAVKLVETINSSTNKDVKFFVATHHALYYNILHNAFRRNKDCKYIGYILSKNNAVLELMDQKNDTPFAYHLLVMDEIIKAIDTNNIQKFHFNLFRSLLEKTANFLGYTNFENCIAETKRAAFKKVLHLHSHGKLSELESSNVSNENKELFKETFNEFIKNLVLQTFVWVKYSRKF